MIIIPDRRGDGDLVEYAFVCFFIVAVAIASFVLFVVQPLIV